MRAEVIERALRVQRATTLDLLQSLAPEQWAESCLPGWRVRDVVAHLVTTDEAAVTGRVVPLLRSRAGRARMERWNDQAVLRWADRSPEELMAGLSRWGERLARMTRLLPGPLYKLPIGLLYGRLNLGETLLQRVVDEWVHTVDITRVTGGSARAPDPVPAALAAACFGRLPQGILPAVPRTVGVLRLEVGVGAVEATGQEGLQPSPLIPPWTSWGIDFARKHYGPRVGAQPDAVVRMHATTMALLVEARADWREEAVEVEGDEAMAADLLDVLHVTAVAEQSPQQSSW
jgi:uncharacterized protein (TIGR03083 family)